MSRNDKFEIAKEVKLGYLRPNPLLKSTRLNPKHLMGKDVSRGEFVELYIFGRRITLSVIEVVPDVKNARISSTSTIEIIQTVNVNLLRLEEANLSLKFLFDSLYVTQDEEILSEILNIIERKIVEEPISKFYFLINKNYFKELPQIKQYFESFDGLFWQKLSKSISKSNSENLDEKYDKSSLLLLKEIITSYPEIYERISETHQEYLEILDILVENDLIQQSVKVNGKQVEVKGGKLYLNDRDIKDIDQIEGLSSLVGVKVLQFRNNRIKEIRGLEKLHSLQTLVLTGNHIEKIEGLDSLAKLTYLECSRNKIEKLEGLCKLTSLKSLFMGENVLTSLSGIECLSDLRTLHFHKNKISDIRILKNLEKIENLSISTNQISDLSGLEALKNLKQISIHSNPLPKKFYEKFDKIKDEGEKAQKIVEFCRLRSEGKVPQVVVNGVRYEIIDDCLELSNLSIHNFDEIKGLSDVESLVELDLSKNNISEIKDIEKLVNLRRLNLKDNEIPDVVIEQLGGLDNDGWVKNLHRFVQFSARKNEGTLEFVEFENKRYYVLDETLILDDLGIKEICEIKYLPTLKHVKKLEITNNKITKVDGIGSITSLKFLDLHGNEINEITGLETLNKLEKLYLYDNFISRVANLRNLENLKSLDLSFNMITSLEGISQLTNLLKLDLSGNHLRDLTNLEKLTNLRSLHLKDNEIVDPYNLKDLTKLEQIWLSRNQISDLSALKNLPNLKELYLDGNPIEDVSPIGNLSQLMELSLRRTKISDIKSLKNLENINKLNFEETKLPKEERYELWKSTCIQEYFPNTKKHQDEKDRDQEQVEKQYQEYLKTLDHLEAQLISSFQTLDKKNAYAMDDFVWDVLVPKEWNLKAKTTRFLEVLLTCPKIDFLHHFIQHVMKNPEKFGETAREFFYRIRDLKLPNLKKEIVKIFESCDRLKIGTILDHSLLDQLNLNEVYELIEDPKLNFLMKILITSRSQYGTVWWFEELEWFFVNLSNEPIKFKRMLRRFMEKEDPVSILFFIYGLIEDKELFINPKYHFFENFMNFADIEEEYGWYFFEKIKLSFNQAIIKMIKRHNISNLAMLVIRDNYLMDSIKENQFKDLILDSDLKFMDLIFKMLQIEKYLGESEGKYDLGDRINKLVKKDEEFKKVVNERISKIMIEGDFKCLKEIIYFYYFEHLDDETLKSIIKNPDSKFLRNIIDFILYDDYYYWDEEGVEFIKKLYDLGIIEHIETLKPYINEIDKDTLRSRLYNIKVDSKELKETFFAILELISDQGFVMLEKERFLIKKGRLEFKNQKNLTDLVKIEWLEKYVNEITELVINSCPISEIKGLSVLKNLRKLEISRTDIKNIKGLDELSNLQDLNLSGNKITTIEGLSKLTNLNTLDLSSNQILKIDGLNSLKNLKKLKLSSNQISEIEGLENLLALEDLTLYGNHIKNIEGLGKLVNLKLLDLLKNQISEIKGLDNLHQLEYLRLSENKIKDIKGLENLNNLKKLSLGSNQISLISGLDNVSNILELSINDNKICKIEGLDKLNRLKKLYLSYNMIEEIKGLENLLNLEVLEIRHNEIKELKGLGHLNPDKISYILLGGNPVYERIRGLSDKEYITYCRQKRYSKIKFL